MLNSDLESVLFWRISNDKLNLRSSQVLQPNQSNDNLLRYKYLVKKYKKGLCRKGVSLLVVLVACRLDMIMGSNFIRDATVIAFIANETISIIENAGLMGVPIPSVITKAIEVLKKKSEREDKKDGEE